MSQNQSRAEKTEGHLRKPGRSGSLGQNRGFSGSGKGGGGGGGSAPAAALSSSAAPPPSELSTSRSFKKSGNGQGGQSRANSGNSSSDAASGAVQNGAYTMSPSDGPSLGLESGSAKAVDSTNNKKISRAVPKAPASLSAAATSGDESGPFLQFGTINPGIMNGMQVPARTCSAPPNLDEQKRNQVRHDSFRVAPVPHIPTVPKLQQPMPQPLLQHKPPQTMKDAIRQADNRESHPPTHAKRDVHAPIPSTSTATSARSSVLPVGGMPIHVPFQQPQIPVQFSGPNLQMPSQGIVPNSLQMTMTLPSGNVPQVPQPMFVPNIQSHPLQPQTIMHQGQNLGFAPQLGHQLPPQLGSMGIGITPQFPQQQPGNFISQRRAVKITHPDTHEELKLDKRTDSHTDAGTSGQRQLPNAISQSQSFPTFNHQISYYPTTYNPSPMFFPSPSSLPLTSTQMTTGSQAARYSYPVGQNGQTISFMNPSLNPATGGRPAPPPPLHGLSEAVNSEGSLVSASLAAPAQVTVKPSTEKVGTPSVRISMPSTKPESPKISRLPGDIPVAPLQKDKEVSSQDIAMMQKKDYEPPEIRSSSSTSDKNLKLASSMISASTSKSEISFLAPTPFGDVASVMAGNDVRKKEALKKPEPLKDHHKRSSKMELKHFQKDAFDHSGSMTLQQTKTIKDHYMTDTEHSVSKDSASAHSASEAGSFASATSLPSINRESETSELDRKKDTLGASGPSKTTLEEEQSEGASSNCSDPMEVAGHRLSFVETVHLEVSTSSCTDVDGIRLGISGSSLDVCKALEVGQKLEKAAGSVCGRDEVSDGDLLGNSLAGAYPVSFIIGPLDETTEKVKLEVVAESCEKKAGSELCDSDNLQFDSLEEGVSYISGIERTTAESNFPITTFSIVKDTEPILSGCPSFTNVDEGKISVTDSTISKCEITFPEDFSACEPAKQLSESDPMPSVSINQNMEVKDVELSNGIKTPSVLSVPLDKPSFETTRIRNNKKKKRKEILSKADAVGSSDLYNAYKGPEEKQETVSTSEIIESSLAAESQNDTVEDCNNVYLAVEQDEQSKAEIEDWEDAADASTPTLRTSENGEQIHLEKEMHVNCGNALIGKKKYSRDFLLTLSEQCKDLPEGFEIGSDITDILTSVPAGLTRGTDRDMVASPGKIIDRSPGASRGDRRMAGISDDDRWSKVSNTFRMDLSHGVAAMNFRPGQGINHGVLRNPRGQSPNLLSGGILSGPMQSLASQGGIARNTSDADRWQRATGTQRGLMPPPQGPMQVMHKSSNRYEVGKVSDEEEQKQRRLKAILNKLTPQNFDKLFAQVKEVNIDNTLTLIGVISQIFDKALTEPTFCEMYADFCLHLANELPDLVEDDEKITFRRLLLNKCQEEFERGEREQAEADKAEEEGEIHQTEEEREEKRIKVRRRMLGNIRLIGELYKKKMLTERIMHECIKKLLLGQYQNLDEENIEALCKLMSTIGEMIDHPKAREHLDSYFEIMAKLSTNQKLSSRVRFMLKDTIDLRKNRWQQRRKVEGPKKIEDVHRDAAQERQAQTSRSARGPIIPSRRGPPVDYGHRGSSILNSTSSQLSGSIRGLPGHIRDSASQDVRLDDRHQYDSRVPSVPLPQRPTDDGSITLGPQGGLARGMSGRGQGLISNAPLPELSPRINDSHRLASGPNEFSSTSDRIPTISREESIPKFMTNRSSGPTNDQSSFQDRNSVFGIRESRLADRALDRSSVATSARRPGSSGGKISSSSEPKALSEEILQEKSISAIREFYRARDEKEIVYCIRDLNAPSFYSSMVSLWVTDSFERKNIERTSLAQLLVNLSKGHDSLISQTQLIEGFQSVLSSLEDAVNDAPKAAEFLGHIFGKVVVENVLPLRKIGKLICEGGELPGALLEAGLGSEVLGNILEFVKMEKGDSFLNEIRTSSNLRLEDFRPPYPSTKSKKLDAFL